MLTRDTAGLKSLSYKLFSLLLGVLFVYLAVRQVNLSEALRVLGSLDLWWLLAGTLIYLLLAPSVRTLRWRRILRNQKALSFGETLTAFLVGQMAVYVLPARTGELYRAHFLGQRAKMSRSGVVGSIIVERTLDGMILLAMMSLLFLLFPQSQFLGITALVTALVFLILAAFIVFYSFAASGTHRVIDKALGFLPQNIGQSIDLRLKPFLKGIRAITSTKTLLVLG